MKLFCFAASHRKESVNRKLVRVAADMALTHGATVTFAEYGDFDAPIYDDELFEENTFPESVTRFIEYIQQAQGIILASPEYNWSFPGSLKNLIDWASVKKPNPFLGKTILLLSASPSLRGGAQGLVQLNIPLSALGVHVYPKLFTLSKAESALQVGTLNDSRLNGELMQIVEGFIRFTKALE